MFGSFFKGVSPKLTKDSAEWLLVGKYLKERYLGKGNLRQLGLRIDELPCVVRTREGIEAAVKDHDYVNFRQA